MKRHPNVQGKQWFVFLVLSWCVILLGCTGKAKVDRYLKAAAQHEQRGRYQKAIEAYEKASRANPQHARTYHRLGYLHQFLGSYTEAEEAYLKAIDYDETLIDAYVNLGALYYREGLVHRAKAILEEALALDSQNYYVRLNLGHVLVEMEEHAKALEQFTAATDIEPHDPVAYYNQAVVHLRMDNREQALDVLQTVVKEEPRFADAYKLLGTLYEERGEIELAVQYWKKFIEYADRRDPHLRGVRRHYRMLLKSSG